MKSILWIIFFTILILITYFFIWPVILTLIALVATWFNSSKTAGADGS
jgi:hypothetical protein